MAYVDATVFRALRYKPDAPVLPNLRVLSWNNSNCTEPDLRLLLTTNLLEFLSAKAYPAMIVSLKQTCPRLRKLDILTHYPLGPDFISSLSDLVVQLPSLEIIRSPIALTNDAIVHLSMLPNLKQLQIPNDAVDLLRVHEADASHSMFSTLVVLDTDGHDSISVVSLLAQCRPKKLIALILHNVPEQTHGWNGSSLSLRYAARMMPSSRSLSGLRATARI